VAVEPPGARDGNLCPFWKVADISHVLIEIIQEMQLVASMICVAMWSSVLLYAISAQAAYQGTAV
jgi:hypothetical protein